MEVVMQLSLSGAPHSFRVVPGIRYGEVPGVPLGEAQLVLDLLVPEPQPTTPTPTVVYLHGGGWEAGHHRAAMMPWLNPLLAAHGFVTASVQYRLSTKAPFPAQIHDVKAAIRWLRAAAETYGIDPDRIGVWGDSAGGHLAALLGTSGELPDLEGACGSPTQSSRVQAVVTRCAPTDFLRLGDEDDTDGVLARLFGGRLGDRVALRRLASPVSHVHAGMPPFLIVHGTADETVPYEQAELLAQALRSVEAEVTVHTIPGAHHNMSTDPDLPWGDDPWEDLGRQALEFFTKHLNHAA
jgi:acetyl esterase/lipase